MWPTYRDGQVVEFDHYIGESINIGDVIVFPHPHNSGMVLVKRVSLIYTTTCLAEGDNPDPTASTDSHNFGPIDISSIIAFRQYHIPE